MQHLCIAKFDMSQVKRYLISSILDFVEMLSEELPSNFGKPQNWTEAEPSA